MKKLGLLVLCLVLALCSMSLLAQAEETKWFVSDETVPIRIWAVSRADFPYTDELPIINEYERICNVDITYVTATESDMAQKFSIMIASGDIPDLVCYETKDLLSNSEAFAPLDDLIDEYIPNFKALMEKYNLRNYLTNAKGEIVYFPQLTKTVSSQVWLIREDWLENLNLEKPVTLDDWKEVLVAFRDMDANNNGDPDDEIPFTVRGGWRNLRFYEAWDITNSLMVKDGEIIYCPITDEFREYLEYTADLYAEKLIDQEYVTNDLNKWLARMTSDVSGATWDYRARLESLPLATKEANPNALITSPVPPGIDGANRTFAQNEIVRTVGAMALSAKSQYKEEIAKLFNFVYSEEGLILFNEGIEGLHYTVNENGERIPTEYVTNNPDGLSKDQVIWYKDAGNDRPGYLMPDYSTYSDAYNELIDIYNLDTGYIGPVYPESQFKYEGDELSEKNAILTDINTYLDEQVNKFIMGQKDITDDAVWADFVSTIQGMKLDRLLEIESGAYARLS